MKESSSINMESVKQWSDEEIVEYLKEYWGVKSLKFTVRFYNEPFNTKKPEEYKGCLRNVKANNKQIVYPNGAPLYFNIKSSANCELLEGYYEVVFRLAPRAFRETINNMFFLSPILGSAEPVLPNRGANLRETKASKLMDLWQVTDNVLVGTLSRPDAFSLSRLIGIKTVDGRKVFYPDGNAVIITLRKLDDGMIPGHQYKFSWTVVNRKDEGFFKIKLAKDSVFEEVTQQFCNPQTKDERETEEYQRLREDWMMGKDQEDILVGLYHNDKKWGFVIDDVRIPSFQEVTLLDDSPIIIKLSKSIVGLTENKYYQFHWRLIVNTENKTELLLDENYPIKEIRPKALVDNLYNIWAETNLEISGQMKKNMEMVSSQLTSSSEGTFIYELLQNANDYPIENADGSYKPVAVEFRLEDDYLIFRHTGEYFSPRNVAAICKLHDGEKEKKKNAIGYKGIGFKTVFTGSNLVYLKSGPYQFRFSEEERPSRMSPWQIMPIWTVDEDLNNTIKQTFLDGNDCYRVQIALRSLSKDYFVVSDKRTKKDLLVDLFKDIESIVFVPNVQTVRVYDRDKLLCNPRKDNKNWVLSKPYIYNYDPNEIAEINQEIIDNKRIPEKYKDSKDTTISFACKKDGNQIVKVPDGKIYCYLPTEVSFGFPFLMNTDMVPNGQRSDVQKGIKLNLKIAHIAGLKFFEWIESLLRCNLYGYESVFSLIPDFSDCKSRKTSHIEYIDNFQEGFESCINSQKLVPVFGPNNGIEFVCIKDVICDVTGVTSNSVFEDWQFLSFTQLKGYLPHPSLRGNSCFRKLLALYGEKSLRFEKKDLIELFDNDDFVDWLKDKNNNARWIDFVVEKYPEDYHEWRMFISEHDASRLFLASELYYSVDEALPYLSAFADMLPRLSVSTRDNCKILGNEKYIGSFKKYEVNGLVDDILFCEDNIACTQKKLETKNNSVSFIKFLADKQVPAAHLFNKIPLTDIDGNLIPIDATSVSLRKMFFNSEFVDQIRKEQWFSQSWVSVLDNDYYDDGKVKDYLEGYNVSELDDEYVINSLLLDGDRCEAVSNNIGDSLEKSKVFVNYLFAHQDSIKGIEETSKDEKKMRYDRFANYSLFFTNGNGEVKILPALKEVAFNKIKDDYLQYGWFDFSWIYEVSELYYKGKDEAEKTKLADFLKKYFGLADLNDAKFKSIVKDHFEEIKLKVIGDQELNLSFWTFLGKYQWNENGKDNIVFKATPLLLEGESSPKEVVGKKNLFYYHDELKEIANSSWMPSDHILILSKEYDSISGIKGLLDIIGFSTYNAQQFSSFFDSVIVKQKLPTTVPKQVAPTSYYVTLDTKEMCVDFHNFMSKKYHLLNEIEKALLRGTPVYVYGKEQIRRLEVGCGSFILGEDKYGIIKQCAAGLLPEINALDPSFITEENLDYWEKVQGCVALDDESLCQWIEQHSAVISQTIQDFSQNISFWTWLYDSRVSSRAKIGKLNMLPIISFATRDCDNKEENQKMTSLSNVEAYMSNSYMGQAQIEDFARKHGKTSFVSSIYIRESDSIEEWRRFFRNLGVKDDVKDVIYSVIMNDLPTLKDKNLPWVLVDQYSKELADPEKWNELAPKLKELQVETTATGSFISIANALRVTVDDYSQKEPFKMIRLEGEISREYYKDENVKNLINKIAEYAKTQKIAEFQQWVDAKVNRFLEMQDSVQSDDFKNIHFEFVKEWLEHKEEYGIKNGGDIKLYDRDYNLTKGELLFLGSNYVCKCDFERFNIAKQYVTDDYLVELSNSKMEVSNFLRWRIGCQDRFGQEDISSLVDKGFSIYFWCRYVGSKDVSIEAEINSLVKKGAFNDVACIPSLSGEMKKASDLYSSSLADFMKYIPDSEGKIIDTKMRFSEPLIELCKQCKEELTIDDCIDYLINSKPKNHNRTKVLEWLLDSKTEEKDGLIQSYINHEKACWLNGQGEPVHISELLAVDPNHCNQAYVFKTSPKVIDLSYFPSGRELETCGLFNIEVFSDDDLIPSPIVAIDGVQTLVVSREIIRRLLLVIALRYKHDWIDWFDSLKKKMEEVSFCLCESISYGYKELSVDNEDFYFDSNTKSFYYVDGWQDKKVYESFVNKLCEYLEMDLDYRECKGKLDENFTNKKVAKYLNHNCKDLFYDENFVALIKVYWKDILGLLDIEANQEIVDDEVVDIEHVEEARYYEEELQEEEPLDEEQDESMHEETAYDSSSNKELTSTPVANDNQQKGSSETPSASLDSTRTSGTSQSAHPATDYDGTQQEGQQTGEDDAVDDLEMTRTQESDGSRKGGETIISHKSSSSNHPRKSPYEPKAPTPEEIKRFKYQTKTKTFTTEEMRVDEYDALNKILGEGLTAEEIVEENYLAQLRFWGSLEKHGYTPDSISMEDFVRNGKEDQDYKLANGKYIHRCSARGGILYVSPSIWNMVTDDRCIICVFVGAKVNEFFYIEDKKQLLDWISEDAILIKLTGDTKAEVVNKLYSEILRDAKKGSAYTLIRVAYNEAYESLFAPIQGNEIDPQDLNEDDYGD